MKLSNGEKRILSILNASHIDFIREKKFPDAQNYRYDFYIPSHNILIEYDGEEHFYQVPKFHAQLQDFTRSQERDRQKNIYAITRGISLYRIPYWELNSINTIDDILRRDHLVHDKWHNDKIWREHKNSK